jgi:hypothetical protein
METTQVQSFAPAALKMKKFEVREAETVKTTAAARYPWWACLPFAF